MLKVTLKFSFYCVIVSGTGCVQKDEKAAELEIAQRRDSLSESRIDSAYAAIKNSCDTLMIYQVPRMVDSLLKDSALLQHFFDTGDLYTDADKKVEKVIRQLQAECDTSLLKETYRRARLQQQIKTKRHPKRKA